MDTASTKRVIARLVGPSVQDGERVLAAGFNKAGQHQHHQQKQQAPSVSKEVHSV